MLQPSTACWNRPKTLGAPLLVCWMQAACPAQTSPESLSEMLARRAAALRQQIDSMQSRATLVGDRIPALAAEIDRLIEEAASVEVPKPQMEEPENERARPREVHFRPPLLREVDLETPIALICKDGRIAILDFDASLQAFRAIADDPRRLQALIDAGSGSLEAGDFEIKLTLIRIGSAVMLQQEAVPKSGRTGETLDEALGRNSRLRRRLDEINANRAAIQFAVYPDSFPSFSAVRQELWDRGFAINWYPMRHDETVRIGSGPASAQ